MPSLDARKKQLLHVMGIRTWQERTDPVPAPDTRQRTIEAPGKPDQKVRKTTGGVAPDVAAFSWGDLETTVNQCTLCELCESRTRTVFGVGKKDADWMFIGEAPGAEEDRLGQPFVGRAGQLLDGMLKSIGLDRNNNVFIANVLKCRPPGNRDPKTEEADLCITYLNRQIELVQPKLIVAVGRIAAQRLLSSTDSLARLRGKVHHYGAMKTPLIVTYHPAYLLRSPAQKRKAWEDLLLGASTVAGARS